jgi:N-formylglutamate deformylase
MGLEQAEVLPEAFRVSMIFHIPHASQKIPPDQRSKITISADQIQQELVKLTDWFTVELFGCHAGSWDAVIGFPVSRLVVDPERFIDDAQEPMAKVGMGVVYTRTSGGEALRLPPTAEERGLLLDTYYWPHHNRLSSAVNEELKRDGNALILDCHSFPSKPLPYEFDQTPDRPDICIGTDEYHTPRWLQAALEGQCRSEGLTYALNRPFSGSIVPLEHYQTTPNALSIMIEVNRRLYIHEKTGEKSASFDNCRQLVGRMVAVLRAVAADRLRL